MLQSFDVLGTVAVVYATRHEIGESGQNSFLRRDGGIPALMDDMIGFD
jgi:hypothetical protein